MTREEILENIRIEQARLDNADRNIEALIIQRGKSLDKITLWQEQLESLLSEEQEAGV
jgi:hypothetical protein